MAYSVPALTLLAAPMASLLPVVISGLIAALIAGAPMALAEGRTDLLLRCRFDATTIEIRQDGANGLTWTELHDGRDASVMSARIQTRPQDRSIITRNARIVLPATDHIPRGTEASLIVGPSIDRGTCEEPI